MLFINGYTKMANREIDFNSNYIIQLNGTSKIMRCNAKLNEPRYTPHLVLAHYLEEMQGQVQPISMIIYINGSAQDYSSSSASAMELLLSCTHTSTFGRPNLKSDPGSQVNIGPGYGLVPSGNNCQQAIT